MFRRLPPGVHYFRVIASDVAGNTNGDPPVAMATVPSGPPGSQGNATNLVTINTSGELPAWAIVLVLINAVEAAGIAWVALRQRRPLPEGGKPNP